MDEWLKKPWVIRIVSLALAVLLFTAVSLDENTEQSSSPSDFFGSSEETQILEDVPVSVKIDQEKYVVSGVPQIVSVELEGSNSVVTSTATQRNFEVYLDLQGLKAGTYVVPFQSSGISNSLDVYIEPKEVEVYIEERATNEFSVEVDSINKDKIAAGFELGDVSANPSKVKITSSKSIMERVATVKAFVNVENVDESFEAEEVPIKVYDNQGNELSVRVEPTTVDIAVTVNNPNKVVPIEIETTGETKDGVKVDSITPDTQEVRVYAPESVLADIESISTKAINLSGIEEGTTMEVELNIPEEVRKIGMDTVKVTIEVIRTSSFDGVPIQAENLDDNLSLTFLEPTGGQLSIVATGKEDQISKLSLEDFKATIDVSDLQEGEYEVPIVIEGPDGISFEPALEQVSIQIE